MKELKLEELVDQNFTHLLAQRGDKKLTVETLIEKEGSLYTLFFVKKDGETVSFKTLPKAIEYFNI